MLERPGHKGVLSQLSGCGARQALLRVGNIGWAVAVRAHDIWFAVGAKALSKCHGPDMQPVKSPRGKGFFL